MAKSEAVSTSTSIRNSPAAPMQPGSITAYHYESPFPHPDHLEKYEKVYPGAAQLVFQEFHKQGEHRRALEMKVVPEQVKNARTGIIGQCVVGCLEALMTGVAAIFTPPWAPVSMALIFAASHVIIYIHGRNKQSESMAKKN